MGELGSPHIARPGQPRRRARRRARFVVGVEPLWLTPRTVAFAATDEPYARLCARIASTGTDGTPSRNTLAAYVAAWTDVPHPVTPNRPGLPTNEPRTAADALRSASAL